jgi:hypothetical protein
MTVYKSLLDAIAACDKFPYQLDPSSKDEIHHAIPFILGPHTVGNILPSVIPALVEYNGSQINKPFDITSTTISFSNHITTPEGRTTAVKTLMDTWRENKTFAVLSGWRNELFPVYGDLAQPDNVAFVMERAATPLFGISTFGVHLNAFTRNEKGDILMWVARRSMSKPTWPGLLDNCVAGGISYKYSVKETIVKECDEEASIPIELASKVKSIIYA